MCGTYVVCVMGSVHVVCMWCARVWCVYGVCDVCVVCVCGVYMVYVVYVCVSPENLHRALNSVALK